MLMRLRWGRFLVTGTAALALGSAGLLSAEQIWLAGKAALASQLIARSYVRYAADGEAHPPWPWADTHPLARLRVPDREIRRFVLAGASGSSLAFGPGHIDGTALPNQSGIAGIAGHRDGSFAFLEHLILGDSVWIDTADSSMEYRVVAREIRRFDDGSVLGLHSTDLEAPVVKLVTCWPFGGRFPSPWRYVVELEAATVASQVPVLRPRGNY